MRETCRAFTVGTRGRIHRVLSRNGGNYCVIISCLTHAPMNIEQESSGFSAVFAFSAGSNGANFYLSIDRYVRPIHTLLRLW